MRYRREQTAFTIIEMLVVIAIIAVMAGLVMPAIKGMITGGNISAAHNLVRSALSQAQSYAAETQNYAGIRFQQSNNGRQYLVLIEHVPPYEQGGQTAYLAERYTAVANRKPRVMPVGIGAISGEVDTMTSADADDYLNPLEPADQVYCLPNASTFCILFSPTGQLVVKDVVVFDRDDNDTMFGGEDAVASGGSEGTLLHYDFKDSLWLWLPAKNDDAPSWCVREPSTLSLYIYRQGDLAMVDELSRYSQFISRHEALDTVEHFLINVYTGGIIR